MDESAKKSTRVSNLDKMAPEQRARAEAFLNAPAQLAADALNLAVAKESEQRKKREEAEKARLAQKDHPDPNK